MGYIVNTGMEGIGGDEEDEHLFDRDSTEAIRDHCQTERHFIIGVDSSSIRCVA